MRPFQETFDREAIIYSREEAREGGLYREDTREGGLYREEAREGGIYREEMRDLYERELSLRGQPGGHYSREEEARGLPESSLYARPHGLAAGLYAAEDGAEELPLELTKHAAEERPTEAEGKGLVNLILS
jgi:hypothetical protein